MTHTLASFAAAIRHILLTQDNPSGREKVAALLHEALQDTTFVATLFSERTPERKVVYEDAQLGFCILAHQYSGPGESAPHDHGPSWAIYGQAEGETVMTDWAPSGTASPGTPAPVKRLRSYPLSPGMAHLYNEGAIHSPSRAGPTKLVRIEGTDLAKVARGRYTPLPE